MSLKEINMKDRDEEEIRTHWNGSGKIIRIFGSAKIEQQFKPSCTWRLAERELLNLKAFSSYESQASPFYCPCICSPLSHYSSQFLLHQTPPPTHFTNRLYLSQNPVVPLSTSGTLALKHILFTHLLASKLSRAFKTISNFPKYSNPNWASLMLAWWATMLAVGLNDNAVWRAMIDFGFLMCCFWKRNWRFRFDRSMVSRSIWEGRGEVREEEGSWDGVTV